ncbi:MAG: polysulfide reductase NrfD, partial [Deltaproteobacteria bacterium]|nr:polysulfide reductase NrfD [Deltaproteobacteria bacterium]
VFCGLLTLWGGLAWLGFQLPALLKALLVVGGVMTTVYTAFLFAQAKGRDFWQSPLMSVHMLAQGAMAGSAAWLGLAWYLDGALPGTTVILLQVAIVAHLLVMLVEFTLPHSSRDVELVTEMILHGPFQKSFAAAVILGNLLPLGLLSAPVDELRLAAAVLVLLFALVVEHIWVRAPQLVSLR